MITVEIRKDSKKHIVEFTVSGHAEYIKAPKIAEFVLKIFTKRSSDSGPFGLDILCSSVSSIAQSAVLGLKEVAGLDVSLDIDNGFLKCIIPEVKDEITRIKTDTITSTMVISLQNIQSQYNDYIEIIEMEV